MTTKKKSAYSYKCCVSGCSNVFSGKVCGKSFHRFPTNEELRLKWIRCMQRENVSKNGRICSDHFTEDCYVGTSESFGPIQRRRLHGHAVPTVFKFPPHTEIPPRKFRKTDTPQKSQMIDEDLVQSCIMATTKPEPAVSEVVCEVLVKTVTEHSQISTLQSSSAAECQSTYSWSVVPNSFCKTNNEGTAENMSTLYYCQHKEPPPPPKNNGAMPPYKLVELPPPSKSKTRPTPRPAQPPDISHCSLPPSLHPLTTSAIVVPPTSSLRTKAPPVPKDGESSIDLLKIVYEEKKGEPIMYASQQARPGPQHNTKRPNGGFKIKVRPVGKLQQGKRQLRGQESHEPPPPDEEAPSSEEVEEERRGRQIVTQKNVRPTKICDLEDLTCLDSLFPFLSSFLLISEDAPPSAPVVPGAVLDLSAQNFLLAWSERWRRRTEKAAGRAKVDGPFQLGECPLQGRKFAVFEAGAEGEKLLALPPEQISPPAFSFCPPRPPLSWRPAHSESSALVAVSCCCPLDRLLALLDAADEPVAPLKRCLALAALVLALASGLPPSLPPSQVLVLLSRHDLRFLLPEPVPPPSSEPPVLPPPSPLERLAPHMSVSGGEAGDLAVALEAFRGAVLPGRGEASTWRREAGSLLLPRLFARFEQSDFFAPFLAGLLIAGEL